MRALALLPVFLVAACAPTVGTRAENCDEEAAREIVYQLDGTAYYLGQALILQGCSRNGAFCHGSGAADRYGAPFGFDFDPFPTSASPTPAELSVLATTQARIHANRNDIWAAILDGSMPPGTNGRCVAEGRDCPPGSTLADPAVVYFRLDSFAGTPVPLIENLTRNDGREALRNWLACGSPVIERSPIRIDFDLTPRACSDDSVCIAGTTCDGTSCNGEPCDSDADCGADRCGPARLCVPAGCETDADCGGRLRCGEDRVCAGIGDVVDGLAAPQPTWASIYANVIDVNCGNGGCHQGGTEAPAGLDLLDIDLAYANLVDVPAGDAVDATGSECGASGLDRVEPGMPEASLLLLKIEPPALTASGELNLPEPPCGASMPYGSRLSDTAVLAVREWIARGALR